MQFQFSRLVVLSLLLAAISADAQDVQSHKCSTPARECEQQIRQMLTGKRYLGVQVEEMNPGLLVKSIVPDSPADRAGLDKGDRLMAVNGHSTVKATIADFKKILGDIGANGRLWIIVQRHGVLKTFDARLEPYSKAQIDKIVAQHLQEEHPAEAHAPASVKQ
jgi:predicted metalloprotease with PDZ domain